MESKIHSPSAPHSRTHLSLPQRERERKTWVKFPFDMQHCSSKSFLLPLLFFNGSHPLTGCIKWSSHGDAHITTLPPPTGTSDYHGKYLSSSWQLEHAVCSGCNSPHLFQVYFWGGPRWAIQAQAFLRAHQNAGDHIFIELCRISWIRLSRCGNHLVCLR